MGKNENANRFYFPGLHDYSHEINKHLVLGRKAVMNLEILLKSRGITLPIKVWIVKAMGFPVARYGQMWELDYKEGWALKNWCFWTVMLEKILESPLDSKEIKPVNPKGNLSWIFIGRTDAKTESQMLKLKLHSLATWMQRVDSLNKTLRLERLSAEDEMVG